MRVHPSDSLSLQAGKSPLHRSSPAGSSRAGPLCKSHRPISERPVTPRVESIKPHSLSQPRASLRSTLIVFAIRPLAASHALQGSRSLILCFVKRLRPVGNQLTNDLMAAQTMKQNVEPTSGSDEGGPIWGYHFVPNQLARSITSEAAVEFLTASGPGLPDE